MKFRRILPLALTLALCLGLFVLPAGAAEHTVTEVVPIGRYQDIHKFSEGFAAVRAGADHSTQKWGFIDTTGREVVPCKYDRVSDFSEGLAWVNMGGQDVQEWYEGGVWGFVDSTGREVIPCSLRYDRVEDFQEGMARVVVDLDLVHGTYGFIDKTGREIIPCKYSSADHFSEGLAVVYRDGQGGYIDKTGQEAIHLQSQYKDLGRFSEGLAKVGVESGEYVWDELEEAYIPVYKYGFIDKSGTLVIECKYTYAYDFVNGMAQVALDGRTTFIDQTGQEIMPYEDDRQIYRFSEGLAAVRYGKDHSNSQWGYVDKTGQLVIPLQYTYATSFDQGLAVVQYPNKKYGIIDKTGAEVVPPKYDYIYDFSEGFARVQLDRKYGLIDRTGKEVLPCQYDYDFNTLIVQNAMAVVGNWDTGYGVIAITAVNTAYERTQRVEVNGVPVIFPAYALKDENGNETNYVKVRDFASFLNGMTEVKFDVTWNEKLGAVDIVTGRDYLPNGSELTTPFSGDRPYETPEIKTLVDGKEVALDTFQLYDDNGGGYTYYKLRDLGAALGITVDWTAQRGVYIETR